LSAIKDVQEFNKAWHSAQICYNSYINN
jgi:hypothetical protein